MEAYCSLEESLSGVLWAVGHGGRVVRKGDRQKERKGDMWGPKEGVVRGDLIQTGLSPLTQLPEHPPLENWL